MPRLLRLLIVNAAIGFGVSAIFVAALIWTDTGQLGTLIASSPVGWLAAGILFFFVGLTFASVQMGVAVMRLDRDSGGSGKRLRPSPMPVVVPVRAKARAKPLGTAG